METNEIKLEDIRIKRIYATRTNWFGKKTKVCVENVIEVKYDGFWEPITIIKDGYDNN